MVLPGLIELADIVIEKESLKYFYFFVIRFRLKFFIACDSEVLWFYLHNMKFEHR